MDIRKYLYNLSTDKESGNAAGIFKILLSALSFFYGLAVRILTSYQRLRPFRLDCKVISVGNITWGGTGKTPLVEYVARHLKREGRAIAILSRGYKRDIASRQSPVANRQSMGDEPYMLFKNLGDVPVIVDANRIRGAGKAIKEYAAKTVILDDGFQQWRIKKDLEIVVIDALNPFGNRHMIPRGILREPLSALGRADIFVLTKTNLMKDRETSVGDLKEFLGRINPGARIFESAHQVSGFHKIHTQEGILPVDAFAGKTVALISGIADPESFENLAESTGLKSGLTFRFPDHYGYQKKDMEDIAAKAKEKDIDTLITTEKDAARIPLEKCVSDVSLFALKIQLKITDNEEEFTDRIRRVFAG